MDALETLNREVRMEELALQAIERELVLIRRTGRPDLVRLHQLLDFARNFEDKAHRQKEEDHLFVHLKEHGNPSSKAQLDEMARELEDEARLIRVLAEATGEFKLGDPSTVDPIRDALRDYHDRMRARVRKENAYLLPLLRRSLSSDEMRRLDEEFRTVDEKNGGPEAVLKFEKILKQAAG